MTQWYRFLFLITTSLFAGKFDSAVKAFETAPEYVSPIATILGTFGSTGWNHKSSISKEFCGSVSLPVTFVVIADEDRMYNSVFVDTNLFESNLTQEEINARAYVPFTAPTIFGRTAAPTLKSTNLNGYDEPAGSSPVYFSDGIEEIASFNWLPLPALQAEFSAYYTSIKLRYLGKPGKKLGVHFPGIGLQHDCSSFLPELPLNISFFGNIATPILNWRPGNGITGTLEMRGFTSFTGITIGKNLPKAKLDLLLETGWEHSTLSTGGELYIASDSDWVRPDMKLEGRNRFRVGIICAFNPGKHYQISGGIAHGSEQAFMASPLGFRFAKSTKEQVNHPSIQQTNPTEIVQPAPEVELIREKASEMDNITEIATPTLPVEE